MAENPISAESSFQEFLALPAMTLATATREGVPHAATLYFAAGRHLELYFLSAPASQHIQDLTANPRASATIFPEVRTWQAIRGLQLRGRVDEIPLSFQKLSGWGYYLAKFPFVGKLSGEVAKNRFYVFTPDWICLTDNRVHFGYKREWTGAELAALAGTQKK